MTYSTTQLKAIAEFVELFELFIIRCRGYTPLAIYRYSKNSFDNPTME